MQSYTSPKFKAEAFHCPLCGVYAHQFWAVLRYRHGGGDMESTSWAAFCAHCHAYSLWNKEIMVYPKASLAPLPNDDLPDEIKADYDEARDIVDRSPRGAAALLRLCIQKLCIHLGERGKDLDSDIGQLVKKGLSPQIQKALDIVRVIGNNAVHPGEINLRDDPETATRLFELVNLIADQMITQPKRVADLYDKLPKKAKEAIRKRNGMP